MALAKLSQCLALLFLLLALRHLVEAESTETASLAAAPSPATKIDCGAACAVRCSKTWKQKMCKKVCRTCCSRCNCVPPGTSVYTRPACPCYATMTTHGGRLKCP
ncbi:gibberellin-regulated protein 2-like [Zingiber officinale]|uniref:gibberellin-regulated protein 2-like n=1 Tax=Zingiber officinale TaxID=94328 RepID=UPI001C4B4FC1|nr:gibberellin-regulated protein 2-like [Zingiber officinale]